jgi:hypothetical protein
MPRSVTVRPLSLVYVGRVQVEIFFGIITRQVIRRGT